MNAIKNNRSVAVIGAGPAGLAAARSLKSAGIPFVVYEKHSDVGGIWDQNNEGSPMYDSAHFISSRTMSGFAGFPMPATYPDYPSHIQILEYIRDFARSFGLYEHIRFDSKIRTVARHGQLWRVELDSGEKRDFRGVICASGSTWIENLPRWPGEFSGEIRHSRGYRSIREFMGKRVLIVGAGNSGVDIACDAAQAASAAYLSIRRGYHFVPKHTFGKPTDVFAARQPPLPLRLRQWLFQTIIRIHLGDTRRLGMPEPDHRILESHPIMNSQIVHYLQHGDIEIKPDIDRLDGDRVLFNDGTSVEVDIILCATGYTMEIPYLEPGSIPIHDGRPDLYLNIFSRDHEGLFGLSFLETNAGVFSLFDTMSDLIVNSLRDREARPDEHRKFRDMVQADTPDLSGGVNYVQSERSGNYVNKEAYKANMDGLLRKFDWQSFSKSAASQRDPGTRRAPALVGGTHS